MKYKELVGLATSELKHHGVYEGLAMRLMIERTLELGLDFYAINDQEANPEFTKAYLNDIQRLVEDEPLAHVLGYEWFFGRLFKITPDVLIPREETEELVENVLLDIDEYFEDKNLIVADIGTGSGNIGLTLKAEEPSLQLHLTDISEKALAIAQENAKKIEAKVNFYRGDMAQPLIDQKIKLDVLVCNPPYIQAHEEVQTSVLKYEPHVALFGGDDGLKYYRQVLKQSHEIMKPKFMMAFEIGFDQGKNLTDLIKEHYPKATVIVRKDLNRKDRMVFVYNNLVALNENATL